MKKAKWAGIVLLLLLAGIAAFLVIFNQPGFTGARIKNPDAYLLDIQNMNGSDQHTMQLTAGDVLQVAFETDRGDLRMSITAPDGTSLYAGNGIEATAFTINISESGAYTVIVEGQHAAGRIAIRLQEGAK